MQKRNFKNSICLPFSLIHSLPSLDLLLCLHFDLCCHLQFALRNAFAITNAKHCSVIFFCIVLNITNYPEILWYYFKAISHTPNFHTWKNDDLNIDLHNLINSGRGFSWDQNVTITPCQSEFAPNTKSKLTEIFAGKSNPVRLWQSTIVIMMGVGLHWPEL